MNKVLGFTFFLLFLAAIAFISLKDMRPVAEMKADIVTGKSWQPVALDGESISDETPLFVQFTADGKMTGHGGCNGFFGNYEVAGETFDIGPIGATRMSCPEPVMDLETRFLDALDRTEGAKVLGNRLNLVDSGGVIIAELVRVAQDADKRP